jgi:hypothetical protein
MADMDRSTFDWEKIEAQYRVGTMSLREIGAEHSISEGAIRKRAKRDKWDRDLKAKVRARAEALVRKELVRSEVRKETPTEAETVEATAQMQAKAEIAHQTIARRLNDLNYRNLEELEHQAANRELYEQLGEIMRSSDETASDKRDELYQRVIRLPARLDGSKKLADAVKIGVEIERRILGIDTTADKVADAFTALMDLHNSVPA